MKTFETFFAESAQLGGPHGSKHFSKQSEEDLAKDSNLPYKTTLAGGYSVLASTHAQARAVQRRNDVTDTEWKKSLRKTTNHLNDNKIKAGNFMVLDKEQGLVYVISVKNRIVTIVTVYPKNHSGKTSATQAAAGQKEFMVENQMIMESYMESDLFLEQYKEAIELCGTDDIQVFVV